MSQRLRVQMADFLPVVHQYLAASRLPSNERDEALQVQPPPSPPQYTGNGAIDGKVHCRLTATAYGKRRSTSWAENTRTATLILVSDQQPSLENSQARFCTAGAGLQQGCRSLV